MKQTYLQIFIYLSEILNSTESITSQYLNRYRYIPTPKERRKGKKNQLLINSNQINECKKLEELINLVKQITKKSSETKTI